MSDNRSEEKVIIIGNRLGFKNGFPEPTHGEDKKEHLTVQEVVGHLDDLWISYDPQKHKGEKINNHIAR